MSYEMIIEEIKAGLTGNTDQDLQYLRELMESYKGHENSKEILRECGRIMYDILPEETKEELRQAAEKDDAALDHQLEQVEYCLLKKDYGRALKIIEPIVKMMDMLIDAGLSENDSSSEYYCFSELFQVILHRNMNESQKEYKTAQQPFSKAYLFYGILLVDLKRYEEATAALEKSLRWNPCDTDAFFEYAETFKFRGDLQRFFELTKDAFKIAYKPAAVARCFRNLGYYYTEMKQWEMAVACITMSTKYMTNDKNAQSELYYIEHTAGRTIAPPHFEDFKQFAEANDFPAGASPVVLGIAAQFGLHFLDDGRNDLAEYFLSIYYDLTDDEEVKEILDELNKEKNEHG